MIIKKNMDILANIWEKTGDRRPFICPQCGRTLTIVQMEPIFDAENAYTPYKTVIECTCCSFSLETESFTILGGIRDFTGEYIEIASWSPTGSRVLSKYPHQLPSERLQEIKDTDDLVEFLIVNNQAVEIIG
ncbi:MAG: hypothetical protein V1726_03730 [Methanobacteriota archaeon]